MTVGAVVLLAAFVMNSHQTQGSDLSVQFGDNLHLEINKDVMLSEGDVLVWKFEQSNILKTELKNSAYNPTFFSNYEKRAELGDNFSLILKNVQFNDSGVYTAEVKGNMKGNNPLNITYNVTVQGSSSKATTIVTSTVLLPLAVTWVAFLAK